METLLARLADLQHWEIALLAVGFLLQGAFLAVFPEELIITTLGFLWSQNRIGFVEALVAIWMGLLPANAITVFFGSRFGPRILTIRPFCWMFKKDAVEESLARIRHHGPWIVFVTRFTPVIRGPIYLASGLSQMGLLRFMKIDGVAAMLQVPLLLFVGSVIGRNADSLVDGYKKVGLFMASLIGMMILFKFILKFKRSNNR
jgi:membrane protein DedA with SNARE-associated domain